LLFSLSRHHRIDTGDYSRNQFLQGRVLNGPRIPASGGDGFAAGFDALKPYFYEMFLGRRDVRISLAEAQRAANAAAQR
jgi:hypothetical protein